MKIFGGFRCGRGSEESGDSLAEALGRDMVVKTGCF